MVNDMGMPYLPPNVHYLHRPVQGFRSLGRSQSPAFAARESSEFGGRAFSETEAALLRRATATFNDDVVDRTPAYDEAKSRIKAAVVIARRAAMKIVHGG